MNYGITQNTVFFYFLNFFWEKRFHHRLTKTKCLYVWTSWQRDNCVLPFDLIRSPRTYILYFYLKYVTLLCRMTDESTWSFKIKSDFLELDQIYIYVMRKIDFGRWTCTRLFISLMFCIQNQNENICCLCHEKSVWICLALSLANAISISSD